MSRQQKLQQAIDLIKEIQETFSDEKKVCECCGFESYVNWGDKQSIDQLNGAITRLERVMRCS